MKTASCPIRAAAFALAAILLLSCGVFAQRTQAAEDEAYDISSAPVPVYYEGKPGSDSEEITMYFLDGNRQIAYYDMDTVVHIMTKLYREAWGDYEADPDYALTYEADGDTVTFTRENGYTMELDLAADTVTFFDYDEFICHSYDMTAVDLSHSSGYDEDGQAVYLRREEDSSYSRYGDELVIDLAAYDIDLPEQDGLYLIPAQTMNDILLTTTYTLYLYNSESAFYVNYDDLLNDIDNGTGMAELYYADGLGERSRALIDYTYNELCMVLDHEYGLQESHGIGSFDEYFEETAVEGASLKTLLTGDDQAAYEAALYNFTYRALDDLHSGYLAPCAYESGESDSDAAKRVGVSVRHFISDMDDMMALRAGILADENGNIPGYQEVGNTAYITFDSFTVSDADYYEDPPETAPADTVGLLIYANAQIRREDSPIENVVLDLTCNIGGQEDAAAFVCAWFLGDAQVYMQNSVTGASSVNVYACDADLDRAFGSGDTVSDLHLYCLISPVTFSCGNLAATMFACSGKVTLIGRTTGGGSCVVLPLTTASGSILQVSGFRMISAMKNGSFYNADQGVDPDFTISDYSHFYDREYMTDYINNLP